MQSNDTLLHKTFARVQQDKIDAYIAKAISLGFSIVPYGGCTLCAAADGSLGCALRHAFGPRFLCSDTEVCIVGNTSELPAFAAFISTLQ